MKTKSFLLLLVATIFIACGQSADNDQKSNPSATYKVGSEVNYELLETASHDDSVAQRVFRKLGFDEDGILYLDATEASAVFDRLLVLEKALKETTVASHVYEVGLNRATTQFPKGAFDDNFYVHDGMEYRMIAQLEKSDHLNYWSHLSLILPRWGECTSHEMDIVIRLDEEGGVLGGDLHVLRSDLCKLGRNKSDADPKLMLVMRDMSDEWKFYDSFIKMFEDMVPYVGAKTS